LAFLVWILKIVISTNRPYESFSVTFEPGHVGDYEHRGDFPTLLKHCLRLDALALEHGRPGIRDLGLQEYGQFVPIRNWKCAEEGIEAAKDMMDIVSRMVDFPDREAVVTELRLLWNILQNAGRQKRQIALYLTRRGI